MAIKIGFINQKGGVAKTTSVIEVATCLGKEGKRVLVVDCDQQRHLSIYSDADLEAPSLFEILNGEIYVKDAIQHKKNYDIITASGKLSKADKTFTDADDVYLMVDVCDEIDEDYDFILFDNSPARNILLSMVYNAVSYIVIPTESDKGSLIGLMDVHNDLIPIRDGKRPQTKAIIIEILITKAETNTISYRGAKEAIDNVYVPEIESVQHNKIQVHTISKATNASNCKIQNKSMQEYDPYNNVSVDYRKFTKSILERVAKGELK